MLGQSGALLPHLVKLEELLILHLYDSILTLRWQLYSSFEYLSLVQLLRIISVSTRSGTAGGLYLTLQVDIIDQKSLLLSACILAIVFL